MMNIYPSLMAANQLRLEDEVLLLKSHCAGFHLDIMDNHFVPNITWGADTVNALSALSGPVWVHLMVEEPMRFYETLNIKEGSFVSIHIESGVDFFNSIKIIKEKKHKPSIAISPKTAISCVIPFINIVDQILLMSVDPGFSGQRFLDDALDRLKELALYRKDYNATFRIGIDGGIDENIIKILAEKGVNDCAIGNGIFKYENPKVALERLRKLLIYNDKHN